ncbi:Inner membrane protein translocase and chaperone YidC, long form [hydrothermal vent metagenome]|uniref:Membrane protein insertase YidC n=1 Tax=hydrothermal vent metagenome TaxID=652676 RepID=A0A3B0UPZ6_9ZZZZ
MPLLIIQEHMNKNSILGFILIGAILIGSSIWMAPSKEKLAAQKRKQDSLAMVMQRYNDSVNQAKATALKSRNAQKAQENQQKEAARKQQPKTTKEEASGLAQKYGAFSSATHGKKKYYTIETDLAKFSISKKGGFINSVELKKYKTWDQRPLYLFDSTTSRFGISFFSNNKVINTKKLYFSVIGQRSGKDRYVVSGNDSLRFVMRVYANKHNGTIDSSRYIDYVYTFKGNNYMLNFNIEMHGMQRIIPANMNYVELKWYVDLLQEEKTVDTRNGATIYYKFYKDNVDNLSERKDEDKTIKTNLKWVSFKQRFFSSTLIAKQFFNDGVLKVHKIKKNPPTKHYLKSVSVDLTVPFNVQRDKIIPMSLYFGPNDFTTLKSYGMQLEHQIPIGWGFFILAWVNEWIIIPVFNWLGSYGWNYGIVILVLTILLKMALFPIAYKTYMSSAKMRVLKPEVDEINAKFPKKEDSMKKQQAVMALYRKAGANPASGCIPMLLQMPILFAMFEFFPSAIQLRQQSFLWAHDLSSYDSILHLPWNIPFYGDHVSLFTLLMTVSTIMYTYLNNQMMGSQTQSMPGMKNMMYIMPILFLGIFNNYASGLSYYYFLANIITFLQMYLFKYAINEEKLLKRIEMNKKKPKKKSGFQKRLEEAAKQRSNQRR